jgi:hypothetical protein
LLPGDELLQEVFGDGGGWWLMLVDLFWSELCFICKKEEAKPVSPEL